MKIGGGLYHVIARGNNRRKIFRSHDDYQRFTSTLEGQKAKLSFYLYAYCLNHVHLLIEMQDDPVGPDRSTRNCAVEFKCQQCEA